ncbi:NADP-specific glutamate dehydrogenase [Chloroflexi bacterium TSY]|nr:NADP-specific glutamate dehydrogenase [Chloroflexi bacterium TSY]
MELGPFMQGLKRRNPGQPEFHQAVHEVAEKVIPFINANPQYEKAQILERMTEPDRIIIFRVCWEDDEGHVRVNRGYRVQFNNAIGPYKGGLRFDKSVSLSILKFLGFEQTFKNSLTTLPIGGAKGGSDFNPKGKSDGEVMRFCQSFMTELSHHIGKDTDVPAGDIGVGAREISYLFGQHKRLTNEFTGVLTGKGLTFGGSPIRTEATGYGCVYLGREMLKTKGEDYEGKVCVVSGSGNVAQYTAEKLIELGAKVVTMSDRGGYIYDADGLTTEKLAHLIDLKTNQRGRLAEYAKETGCEFHAEQRPWHVPCDMAFPSATQNEILESDARALLDNGCLAVCEGANMPTVAAGAVLFEEAGILYAPSKAANAGGVAISGLEMTQNAMRLTWSREEVDSQLQNIMRSIHEQCVEYGSHNGQTNYVQGANIAGFVKVADAMTAYGVL